MKQYDFVVIRSGIAGLSFALKAAKSGSVAVITKRKGADSNTAWAQGGVACVTSDEDSFELHGNQFRNRDKLESFRFQLRQCRRHDRSLKPKQRPGQ